MRRHARSEGDPSEPPFWLGLPYDPQFVVEQNMNHSEQWCGCVWPSWPVYRIGPELVESITLVGPTNLAWNAGIAGECDLRSKRLTGNHALFYLPFLPRSIFERAKERANSLRLANFLKLVCARMQSAYTGAG